MALKKYINVIGPVILGVFFLFLINPMNLGVPLSYLLVFLLIFFRGKDFFGGMDKDSLWILIFGLSYALFNSQGENQGVQFLIIQAFFPFLFYLVGKFLIPNKVSNSMIISMIMVIAVLFSFTSLMSVGSSILRDGFVDVDRNVPNIWTGKEMLATSIASFLAYNLLIPGILLANRKSFNWKVHLAFTLVYLLTLFCTFRLGSRMSIAITAVGILVGIILIISSQYVIENIRFISGLIVAVAAMLYFFPVDLDADYLSVLGERLQDKNASSISTAGNRTALWAEAWDKLFRYPLGWQSDHYAHNVWLDIGRVAGVIPLILFLINNITVIRNLLGTFRVKNFKIGVATSFTLVFVSSFLVFFGEPVLEGSFFVVTLYFLYQGIMKRYLELSALEVTTTSKENDQKVSVPQA